MNTKIRIAHLNLLFALFTITSCNAQTNNQTTKTVGGPCEGCEAIFEYGNKKLSPTDTLPTFKNNEPKLKLVGTVLKKDGKTPAENIILYIYHTNKKGIYETKGNETGWAQQHGYIRGWIKTGKDGKYTFNTFRPAAYPDSSEPEHIHITIKEHDKNEYYLDDFLFDDDPSLTPSFRAKQKKRGGSGIVKPVLQKGILAVHRDIILGKNIPNY